MIIKILFSVFKVPPTYCKPFSKFYEAKLYIPAASVCCFRFQGSDTRDKKIFLGTANMHTLFNYKIATFIIYFNLTLYQSNMK